jgi:UDP-N-acetylmuramate--alanine ligase
MELNKIHKVYFIGIGGIGMSALARYFVAKGASVAGYDKTPSLITDGLLELGVDITFDDVESEITDSFIESKNALVVYTPAIPESNVILNLFQNSGLTLMKRSEVLGVISRGGECLAVAGTHGKTTTSALLGHIMAECNSGASAFVGGIITGYNSNLILGDKDVMVVEADEYDRSFLHLSPDIACITSMDADHLDIYGDSTELKKTFFDFTDKLSKGGILISKAELGFDYGLKYSINQTTDYTATDIEVKEGKFHFNIISLVNGNTYHDVTSNLPGKYNVENTLAAFAMAEQFGLDGSEIVKAIESFEGIYRRFNVFSFDGKIIVDDYAHHPSEIGVSLEAARELFINEKIAVIFQPHLYSRTRDFESDFANILSEFDEVNLLDIYPARELPIEGISSKALLEKILCEEKNLISKDEIQSVIKESDCEVVMMLGAGDISVEIEKLKKK